MFSGRRPIRITQPDVKDRDAYQRYLAQLPRGSLPVAWRLTLDGRLVPFPAEPALVRITARIINGTDPVSRTSLDFADPNIYAVTLEVDVPQAAHRPTIFRELPASFRFNREMFGVGINGHVEGRSSEGTVYLAVKTVPVKTIPRLEPREIPNAEPTFVALIREPIAVLSRIADAMRAYDKEAWDPRIQSLAGQEQQEARPCARSIHRRDRPI